MGQNIERVEIKEASHRKIFNVGVIVVFNTMQQVQIALRWFRKLNDAKIAMTCNH